jgi:hypothetical protein
MSSTQVTTGRAPRNAGRERGKSTKFAGTNKALGVFETYGERVSAGRSQNQFIDTLDTLGTYAAEKLGTKEGKTNIRNLLRDMVPFLQVPPIKPIQIKVEEVLQSLDVFETTAYFSEVSDQKRKQDAFNQGSTTMWSVIWNQSSTKMHTELEALDDFVTYEKDYDILELLKAIKIISYKFDHHRQLETSITTALEKLLNYYQDRENLDDYFKSFKSRCEVIEQFGGSIGAATPYCYRTFHEREHRRREDEVHEEDTP